MHEWYTTCMRYLTVALSLFLCSCISFASAEVAETDYDTEQASRLKVAWRTAVALVDPESGRIFCSGFYVTKGVITAAHCVDDVSVGGEVAVSGLAEVDLERSRATGFRKYMLIRYEPAQDIALLAPLEASPSDRIEVEVGAEPLVGQEIYILGHPRGHPYVVSFGRVTQPKRINGPETRTEVHGFIAPGNSGGPVLNYRGQVVGVLVSGYLGTGLSYAVHRDVIYQLLEEN